MGRDVSRRSSIHREACRSSNGQLNTVTAVIAGTQPWQELNICTSKKAKCSSIYPIVCTSNSVLAGHEGIANVADEATRHDHWRDEFSVEMLGRYQYTVEGWIDRFQTWRGELLKQVAAGQDVYVDLLIGAVLIDEAAGRARGDDAGLLRDWAGRLRNAKDRPEGAHIALEEEPLGVLQRYPVHRP